MNRLIIIGNGFDLAHGLPTSYNDFLNWYWNKISLIDNKAYGMFNYEDNFLKIYSSHDFQGCDSFKTFMIIVQSNGDRNGENYEFRNSFFQDLCGKSIDNWVDIEMFYKDRLEISFTRSDRLQLVKTLNIEFHQVRKLFHQYLNEVVKPMETKTPKIDGIDYILTKFVEGLNFSFEFFEHFPSHLINFSELHRRVKHPMVDTKPINNFILCFNYTNTIFKYTQEGRNIAVEHIHGHHDGYPENLVFGYGDETDELFHKLEKENEREYLMFVKSVSYLKDDRYTKLLNFIDSDDFIVEILGHSLSISDRTLLKMIFENEKCRYIFNYFHARTDGSNNFTDKAINISRHFSDKILMRKKVAPQTFCRPLPQLK